MANNFSELIGKFIISAILIISLLSFIVITQRDNMASQKMSDNPIFNQSFEALSKQITNSSQNSQEQYASFNSEQPTIGFGSLLILGIVSVGKGFSEMTFGFFTGIVKLPLLVLGIDPSIYNLIITWLIVIVVIAVWLLYKLGGG